MKKNYDMLTTQEKQNIIDLFYEGKSKKEIITIANITTRTYPLVFKEYNINTKRKNKYTLNERYFENIDTEEKAYILGLIASDGCVTDTNYFAIASTDYDILQIIKKELEYTGEIYVPQREDSDNWNIAYRINFSSKLLCESLKQYGIYPNKSLTYKDMPNMNSDLMRHYIRGYFDGDGSLWKSTCTSNYKYHYDRWTLSIIATENKCYNLQQYFKDTINEKGHISNSKTLEMKYIKFDSRRALTKIYNLLYTNATCYMNRKHDKWLEFMGSHEEKSSLEKQGELLGG